MKKTILVNYTGRKGGGAAYSYEITKALIEKGLKVEAVVSVYAENIDLWRSLKFQKLVEIKTYNNIKQYIFGTLKFLLFGRNQLKKEFVNENIDFIYCPMIQPWTYFINKIFYKDAKIIVTIHDPIAHSGEGNPFLLFFDQKSLNKADKIVILSATFKEYCMKRFRKKEKDILVLPHGDFSYYKRLQNNARIINYSPININFLFFGRISKYKGLDVLAKAFEVVCKKIHNCTLTIAGSGDFSKFEELYKKFNNVKIMNRWFQDEEIGSLFNDKNLILVLPYIDASQSGVIPIAQEYHVPVIASDTGGLSEQIVDGKTGILFPASDYKALAQKMISLANDKELQQKITDVAFVEKDRNSWDKLADKLIKFLN